VERYKPSILHVCGWYPNKINPKEALWIKRHIDSLAAYAQNEILHFEVKHGEKFKIIKKNKIGISQTIIVAPLRSWFIKEWLYFIWLTYQLLIKRKHVNHNLINFHIAYPVLTHWHLIKKIISKPVVITEHWSAYHFNFGVSKELRRITRIFKHNIPVITVSEALKRDIQKFSKANFPSHVVGNVVNSNIFHLSKKKRSPFFFMVSSWKSPKNPLVVLEAFKEFSSFNSHYTLKIAGYGPQWQDIIEWVENNNCVGEVELIGPLSEKKVADYMQRANAFLHPSNYETFSVVCAEASACGTPVLASGEGGIKEVVAQRGICLESNNKNSWIKGMKAIVSINPYKLPDNRFSEGSIGKKYMKSLAEYI